ncbi:hypothetical protein GCM10009839_74410 [Catenulispora yoronensis]|uniref:Uncharacterized protein n=1 Tax=Catenulispora yoronensis TaxID=450799 RepID=A0ABN2V8S2_9ACTN
MQGEQGQDLARFVGAGDDRHPLFLDYQRAEQSDFHCLPPFVRSRFPIVRLRPDAGKSLARACPGAGGVPSDRVTSPVVKISPRRGESATADPR